MIKIPSKALFQEIGIKINQKRKKTTKKKKREWNCKSFAKTKQLKILILYLETVSLKKPQQDKNPHSGVISNHILARVD